MNLSERGNKRSRSLNNSADYGNKFQNSFDLNGSLRFISRSAKKTKTVKTMGSIFSSSNVNGNRYFINPASPFLENMYLKYSKNLQKYFSRNKEGMKLQGNKYFENISIETFLKTRGKSQKKMLQRIKNNQSIIQQNNNDLNSRNETDGSKFINLNTLTNISKIESTHINIQDELDEEEFFLTPLPNKSRKLLNTKKEKKDFREAERAAVMMRTFEYTHGIRSRVGINQYKRMLDEERDRLINMLLKSATKIQRWWKKKKSSKNAISEKESESDSEAFNKKYGEYLAVLEKKKKSNFFNKLIEFTKKRNILLNGGDFLKGLSNYRNPNRNLRKMKDWVDSMNVTSPKGNSFTIPKQPKIKVKYFTNQNTFMKKKIYITRHDDTEKVIMLQRCIRNFIVFTRFTKEKELRESGSKDAFGVITSRHSLSRELYGNRSKGLKKSNVRGLRWSVSAEIPSRFLMGIRGSKESDPDRQINDVISENESDGSYDGDKEKSKPFQKNRTKSVAQVNSSKLGIKLPGENVLDKDIESIKELYSNKDSGSNRGNLSKGSSSNRKYGSNNNDSNLSSGRGNNFNSNRTNYTGLSGASEDMKKVYHTNRDNRKLETLNKKIMNDSEGKDSRGSGKGINKQLRSSSVISPKDKSKGENLTSSGRKGIAKDPLKKGKDSKLKSNRPSSLVNIQKDNYSYKKNPTEGSKIPKKGDKKIKMAFPKMKVFEEQGEPLEDESKKKHRTSPPNRGKSKEGEVKRKSENRYKEDEKLVGEEGAELPDNDNAQKILPGTELEKIDSVDDTLDLRPTNVIMQPEDRVISIGRKNTPDENAIKIITSKNKIVKDESVPEEFIEGRKQTHNIISNVDDSQEPRKLVKTRNDNYQSSKKENNVLLEDNSKDSSKNNDKSLTFGNNDNGTMSAASASGKDGLVSNDQTNVSGKEGLKDPQQNKAGLTIVGEIPGKGTEKDSNEEQLGSLNQKTEIINNPDVIEGSSLQRPYQENKQLKKLAVSGDTRNQPEQGSKISSVIDGTNCTTEMATNKGGTQDLASSDKRGNPLNYSSVEAELKNQRQGTKPSANDMRSSKGTQSNIDSKRSLESQDDVSKDFTSHGIDRPRRSHKDGTNQNDEDRLGKSRTYGTTQSSKDKPKQSHKYGTNQPDEDSLRQSHNDDNQYDENQIGQPRRDDNSQFNKNDLQQSYNDENEQPNQDEINNQLGKGKLRQSYGTQEDFDPTSKRGKDTSENMTNDDTLQNLSSFSKSESKPPSSSIIYSKHPVSQSAFQKNPKVPPSSFQSSQGGQGGSSGKPISRSKQHKQTGTTVTSNTEGLGNLSQLVSTSFTSFIPIQQSYFNYLPKPCVSTPSLVTKTRKTATCTQIRSQLIKFSKKAAKVKQVFNLRTSFEIWKSKVDVLKDFAKLIKIHGIKLHYELFRNNFITEDKSKVYQYTHNVTSVANTFSSTASQHFRYYCKINKSNNENDFLTIRMSLGYRLLRMVFTRNLSKAFLVKLKRRRRRNKKAKTHYQRNTKRHFEFLNFNSKLFFTVKKIVLKKFYSIFFYRLILSVMNKDEVNKFDNNEMISVIHEGYRKGYFKMLYNVMREKMNYCYEDSGMNYEEFLKIILNLKRN